MLDFRNKKITVMGLGLHGGGVGVAKWLAKEGAKVLVTDLKRGKELLASLRKLRSLEIKYVLGKHRPQDFKNVDLIVKNPAVPSDSPYLKIARAHKVPVETDISIFLKMWRGPVIGVTGTKGKSTLTALIGEIFKKIEPKTVVAGNIRISPLSLINPKLVATSSRLLAILELSSWQLEDLKHLKWSPRIAVITNIFPDHLNRYKNLKDYIKAKKIIFKYQRPNDFLVLNWDNPQSRKLTQEAISQVWWFSKKSLKVKKLLGKAKLNPKDIKLLGSHNLENILAAVTVANIWKIKPSLVRQVIRNFKGLEGRLELVRTLDGVRYYNDTTATTPEATLCALRTLSSEAEIPDQWVNSEETHLRAISKVKIRSKKNIILIAGGADKGLNFKELVSEIKKRVKALVLLKGTATPKMIYDLRFMNYEYPLSEVKSMKMALYEARRLAQGGDIILLSPACASFGLFKNEFDRGDKFRKVVKSLNG